MKQHAFNQFDTNSQVIELVRGFSVGVSAEVYGSRLEYPGWLVAGAVSAIGDIVALFGDSIDFPLGWNDVTRLWDNFLQRWDNILTNAFVAGFVTFISSGAVTERLAAEGRLTRLVTMNIEELTWLGNQFLAFLLGTSGAMVTKVGHQLAEDNL